MHPPEDQDPIWELLAQSPPPEPSPRFVARALRAVRELPARRSLFALRRSGADAGAGRAPLAWGLSGALAAAAAALALGLFLRDSAPPLPAAPSVPAFAESGEGALAPAERYGGIDPATEIEAIEHLAQLMAVADPDHLSDELFADLFF